MVELFNEIVTTILEALAILVIAAGTAGYLYRYMEWGCLIPAGVVILAGSLLAAREAKQKGDNT